jgi:hypothetical protein
LRRTIRLSVLTCAISAAIALPATSAGAATTNPDNLDFGNQVAGTTSPAQGTTLTTSCVNLVATCLSLPTDTMNVSVATTGDFVATTDCPASLAPSLLGAPASCTIAVAFRPSGAGPRTGTLSTGTVGVLASSEGPTVALRGTGVASTGMAGSGARKKHKKCKKHKKHKKKKCGKKKKKKKRK